MPAQDSNTSSPDQGIIWFVPFSGVGVCPLLPGDIARVVPGDSLFHGASVVRDVHFILTRDRKIVEDLREINPFDGEVRYFREVSPAYFIDANCPPDKKLPFDLAWIGEAAAGSPEGPQASQSDPRKGPSNQSPPSRKRPPGTSVAATKRVRKKSARPTSLLELADSIRGAHPRQRTTSSEDTILNSSELDMMSSELPRNNERKKMARDQVFISYSHQDKRFLEDLLTHLKPYLRKCTITAWSDQQIEPGSKWFGEIQAALAKTSVAVMLVSWISSLPTSSTSRNSGRF